MLQSTIINDSRFLKGLVKEDVDDKKRLYPVECIWKQQQKYK